MRIYLFLLGICGSGVWDMAARRKSFVVDVPRAGVSKGVCKRLSTPSSSWYERHEQDGIAGFNLEGDAFSKAKDILLTQILAEWKCC